MTPFGYLRDGLFLVTFAAYAFNRLFLKHYLDAQSVSHLPWARAFFHSHFDDLLLMPVALPIALWIQRLLGLRRHDQPPGWVEMAFHLVIWSIVCKGIGPYWLHWGAPDPWDLVCYAAGGIAACLWWHRAAVLTGGQRHEL